MRQTRRIVMLMCVFSTLMFGKVSSVEAKPWKGPCKAPRDYPVGWNALAMKESGRAGKIRWYMSGTFDGGLQFTRKTWNAYKHCASVTDARAHHASPDRQIAVARYVLADQGVCAWPLSSRKLGVQHCHY